MTKALAVALSVVLLAACAHEVRTIPPTEAQIEASRAKLMAERENAPYNLGMSDGCPSGENAAGNPWKRWTKDPQRYSWDDQYRQGWDDGFARCKGQYEAIGRALR